MSFNGSGTFVPPTGQPVVSGTVIQSATFNTLVADIGNTFNNVLPRDGQASMSGQLKIVDGTSSIPGIAFNSEASSGMYRPSSGMLGLVASGVEVMRVNSSGRLLIGSTTDDGTNTLQVTGATKVNGAVTATSFVGPLTGNVTGNVTGTSSGVTGILPVASGGTGVATLTGLAYGNGTGAYTAATAAQLVTALGYVPYNVTNPSGYQSAAQLAAVAANYLPLTGGNVSGNLTFGNNTGLFFKDTGGTTHQTLVYSGDNNLYLNMPVGGYYRIQNAASTATISTLDNGGNLTIAGGLGCTNVTASGSIVASGTLTTAADISSGGVVYAKTNATQKFVMQNGNTVLGYIAADASYCFRVVNSTYGNFVLNLDNNGNLNTSSSIGSGYIASSGNINASGSFTGGSVNVGGNVSGSSVSAVHPTNATINFNNNSYNMYVRMTSTAGAMEWVNSAYSAVIATLTQGGAFSANAITSLSDEKLKTNWRNVSSDFVYHLSNLKSGVYDRIDLQEDATQVGVGAQSLQKFMPEAIMTRDDGTLTVNYGGAAMVSAVELAKLVVKLEARIAELEEAAK